MSITALSIHLQLPGCSSLKEKRGYIKSILSRVHREFNVSVAEVDLQDHWQETIIMVVVVSSDPTINHQVLQNVLGFIESHWPELLIINSNIESL